MATYVLLRIEDTVEAERLIEDAADYPDNPFRSPCQENTAYGTVVASWVGA